MTGTPPPLPPEAFADTHLKDFIGVRIGDVLQIRENVTRRSGETYWWSYFGIVTRKRPLKTTCLVAVARFNFDPNKDTKAVMLKRDSTIAFRLPPERWPSGLVAIRMKLIAKGHVKLDG